MRDLSSEALRQIVAQGEPKDRAIALDELRARVRAKLWSRLPNPRGTCPHGGRIEWDQKGAYSSGYPEYIIEREDGSVTHLPGYCTAFKGIVNDPPTPERQRILDMLDRIKP